MRRIVASILHGAYGDHYEQVICLRHYALTHPDVELKLFASRQSRMESFRALDLSFASSFQLWTELAGDSCIDEFFQFQVLDTDLNRDVLSQLPAGVLAKIDRAHNILPWVYLRDHNLIPPPERYQIGLSPAGEQQLRVISKASGIHDAIYAKPTVSFLWRYRSRGEAAINGAGQKSQEALVKSYSGLFQSLIDTFDCHILVCGMNLTTTDFNREVTDNKYASFGLNIASTHVTYLKGLNWPLELEIASRATVCCGNASGFTEALWIKRSGSTVLMDAPPHYLAKALYRRMPMFGLNNPFHAVLAMPGLSSRTYRRKIQSLLSVAPS